MAPGDLCAETKMVLGSSGATRAQARPGQRPSPRTSLQTDVTSTLVIVVIDTAHRAQALQAMGQSHEE